MRMKPGTDLDEAYRALTPEQQTAVLMLEQTRQTEETRISQVMQESYDAVKHALDLGVPARVLAVRLGVSPARIYQMNGLAS